MIIIFNICKYYIVDKFGCLRPDWRAPCSNPGRVKSFARTHRLQWFWVSDVKWCEMVQAFWSLGELGVIRNHWLNQVHTDSGDDPTRPLQVKALIDRDQAWLCLEVAPKSYSLQLSEVGNLEKGTYRHNINVYQCQIDFGGTKSWQYQLYGFVGFMSCNILIMIVEKIHNVTE